MGDPREIAARLRESALSGKLPLGQAFTCFEVADELDRLMAEVEKLREAKS